jgi:hypothetical protein
MAERKRDYFAARESKDAMAAILSKIESWNNTLESTGYMDKLRDMYSAYHGAYYSSVGEAHQITFGGDDGELTEIAVNHLRNIADHMHTMTTSSRAALECKAVNTDYKSVVQTQLGNGLLDYYMREKKLEELMKIAAKYAIVLGSGWIKLSWNAMAGQLINEDEISSYVEPREDELEEDEEIQKPIPEYEGDVEFDVLSPVDVIVDLSKEGRTHDWIIVRSFKNRYDLIAKYPDYENEIMAIESKDNIDRIRFGSSIDDETDDIPIYEFYHRRSEVLPNGKYIFGVSEDAIFYEGDLPYKNIPLYRISPSDILGTPLGYSPLYDLLPIQDGINSLYSTILTNQAAFGVQNVLNPSGSNIDVNQIGGSLNIIDYNPQAGKPEPLQLTATPPEVFNFLNMLVLAAETVSGINSVVRGNPEASLRSGSAIAMIQSNAIQFMTGLQSSYTHLLESTGLGLIEILQDFADSPRIAQIVGESGKSYIKEFKGEDLRDINRVTVDVANPLTKTISGRVQMADNLLQYQLLKDPEQYVNIINTGNLKTGTEETTSELLFIKGENETMLSGEKVQAIFTDNHLKHINSHKSLLNDPMMRRDINLINLVSQHIQEHINLLSDTDPNILMALGQQPIQQQPPAQMMEGQQMPAEEMEAPQNLSPEEQALQQIEAKPQKVRLPEGVNPEEVPLTPEDNMKKQGLI